jgi:choline dehydrogenase-like flavoprotein
VAIRTDNLALLRADPDLRVAVQRTTFSRDSIGRFICNTWDEATAAVQPTTIDQAVAMFDAVVIGAGMYGAYCAHQIWRRGGKVLLLEAGPFFIPEHGQNLARGLGFDPPGAILPTDRDAQQTRKEVWGIPWRGNQIFPGLAFCVGGKSVFWGGWSPRLTDDVLGDFPSSARKVLADKYERIELQLGVTTLDRAGNIETRTGFIDETGTNGLTSVLRQSVDAHVTAGALPASVGLSQRAPVAAQGDNPTSGLFSFDKYSPVPLLTEAIREDIERAGADDSRRNLFLVPLCRALRLDFDPTSRRVTAIHVFTDNQRKELRLSEPCSVVLAASCIESTRLALESFPTPQIGRNLMVHLRSDFAARIPRSRFPALQKGFVETGALHMPGRTAKGGRYHVQIVAGANRENNGEAIWFRTVPDPDMLEGILRNDNPDFVSLVLRGIGEMLGVKDNGSPDQAISWIDLSPETDEFGFRRAYVHLKTTPPDDELWDEMDEAMYRIAEVLGAAATEFWVNGGWTTSRHLAGKLKSEGGIRDALGTTFHECGTMWMGEPPFDSPTNGSGRFRHVTNAFCADQSLFTRGGSANPVPTGMALARGVADAVTGQDDTFAIEPGFRSLFEFPSRTETLPTGWRHLGAGFFRRHGAVLEAGGGLGLLVFTDEEFEDFVLRLEWRAPTIRNNSGVYVRLPNQRLANFDAALTSGYEVQIDNTGERPGDASSFPQEFNNVFHQTGAVYPVHRSLSFPSPNGHPTTGHIATRRFGEWNEMEIVAESDRLRVRLNGQPTLAGGEYVDGNHTYPRGHVALQNHFKGFGVQFRRIRIKPL